MNASPPSDDPYSNTVAIFNDDGHRSPSVELSVDSITIHLKSGWNLSSVPVLTGDSRLTTLFPSIFSKVFAYEGNYVVTESLRAGVGYWLKSDSTLTQVIIGSSIQRDTLRVAAGWNLVGSNSESVPVSVIESSPPGILASSFFGYNGEAYVAADTIQPGSGYWVRVRSSGALILSSAISPPCSPPLSTHSGEATFYTFADGSGNCMYDPTPDDLMIGAMNQTDYAGSAICGACAGVTGPNGDIFIRIVDRCPECQPGDIDLSPLAFSKIADTSRGRVPITWHLKPCNVTGPIIYHFNAESSQWWTAVQIRNHRYPIASVEYLTTAGTFKAVNRTDYNYFVEPGGMGAGPFTFRVTDMFGHTLIDSGVVHQANGSVAGRSQFPLCASE